MFLLSNLYDTTKEQYSKEKSKSFVSHMELTHIYPKRADYADDFQDFSRVSEVSNLLCDYDGYSLAYKMDNIDFNKDYYN